METDKRLTRQEVAIFIKNFIDINNITLDSFIKKYEERHRQCEDESFSKKYTEYLELFNLDKDLKYLGYFLYDNYVNNVFYFYLHSSGRMYSSNLNGISLGKDDIISNLVDLVASKVDPDLPF